MMAANYRHIGDRENRLGRHYSRFSPFWPTPALSGQSLDLRKLCDAGSNRRSQASGERRMKLERRSARRPIGGLMRREILALAAGSPVAAAPGAASVAGPQGQLTWGV